MKIFIFISFQIPTHSYVSFSTILFLYLPMLITMHYSYPTQVLYACYVPLPFRKKEITKAHKKQYRNHALPSFLLNVVPSSLS